MNATRHLHLATCMLVLSAGLADVPRVCASDPGGHDSDTAGQPVARVLGDIDFPTTTRSDEAQAAFIRGMLLLHLFEYPFARDEFQKARELDPGFAMAYWGEAMTHNHPIWDEQDREGARAVLDKLGPSPQARRSATASPREQDYLGAMDALYGDGTKAERDRAYMRHMRMMAERYPEDHEVRLFYALSLMGLGAGVREVPTYMESAAISQSVFYANRQHPGAAHYLIHAVDDPVHAPLGLEAARALATLAPDAGHSLHMTSHIFTAVGMWEDVVAANREAIRVQNAMRMEKGQPARHWGHYNFWLLYGLLQAGREDEALALLQAAYDEASAQGAVADQPLELDPDRSQVGSLVQMWARYLIEVRDPDPQLASWTFETGEAYDPRLNYHYALAVRSARAGEAGATRQHLEAFRRLREALQADVHALERQAPTQLLYLERLEVIATELEALAAWAAGRREEALRVAREASDLEGAMPHSFGPPFVDLPSAELLGELLLEAERFDQAAAAFALQLERTRNKARSVHGLARAQARRASQTPPGL